MMAKINNKGGKKMKNEKKIIRTEVKNASRHGRDRSEIARIAAINADKKGVNVQAAPYLQNIFYDALDEFC